AVAGAAATPLHEADGLPEPERRLDEGREPRSGRKPGLLDRQPGGQARAAGRQPVSRIRSWSSLGPRPPSGFAARGTRSAPSRYANPSAVLLTSFRTSSRTLYGGLPAQFESKPKPSQTRRVAAETSRSRQSGRTPSAWASRTQEMTAATNHASE